MGDTQKDSAVMLIAHAPYGDEYHGIEEDLSLLGDAWTLASYP